MPEASINEYRYSMLRKGEIWSAENWPMPTPTGDAIGSEHSDHPKFCALITSRLDGGHYARPLLL